VEVSFVTLKSITYLVPTYEDFVIFLLHILKILYYECFVDFAVVIGAGCLFRRPPKSDYVMHFGVFIFLFPSSMLKKSQPRGTHTTTDEAPKAHTSIKPAHFTKHFTSWNESTARVRTLTATTTL